LLLLLMVMMMLLMLLMMLMLLLLLMMMIDWHCLHIVHSYQHMLIDQDDKMQYCLRQHSLYMTSSLEQQMQMHVQQRFVLQQQVQPLMQPWESLCMQMIYCACTLGEIHRESKAVLACNEEEGY
jgi:hypothetical protein